MSSISEITQERLGIIRDTQETYIPNENVLRALGQKTVVGMIGPSSCGKSYLIDALVQHAPEFRHVHSFSTRDPRPDDTPQTMSTIPWEEKRIRGVCNLIDAGEAVQFAFHPTTGDIYGTVLGSYPGYYNILPALSNSMTQLQSLPFKEVKAVGVVTSPDYWDEWFYARSFTPEDANARIAEAARSLIWLLEHTEAAIVNNVPETTEETLQAIQHFVKTPTGSHTPRDELAAKTLLSHIQARQDKHRTA